MIHEVIRSRRSRSKNGERRTRGRDARDGGDGRCLYQLARLLTRIPRPPTSMRINNCDSGRIADTYATNTLARIRVGYRERAPLSRANKYRAVFLRSLSRACKYIARVPRTRGIIALAFRIALIIADARLLSASRN